MTLQLLEQHSDANKHTVRAGLQFWSAGDPASKVSVGPESGVFAFDELQAGGVCPWSSGVGGVSDDTGAGVEPPAFVQSGGAGLLGPSLQATAPQTPTTNVRSVPRDLIGPLRYANLTPSETRRAIHR